MSINRCIKKDVVHICNGILISYKKEWNNAICSNVDGPRDCQTKWSKSDKDRYQKKKKRQIPCDITYMWNLKCDTNELIYETETDSQTKKTDLWFPREREDVNDGLEVRDYQMQAII